MREMKILLWRTHFETKTNLPTRDCSADFVVVRLVNQPRNNPWISDKPSGLTDKVWLRALSMCQTYDDHGWWTSLVERFL